MITTKIEGFDQFAKKLEHAGDEMKKLEGASLKLRCPQCGSTELLADDELGDEASVTCKPHGHVLGRKRDMQDLLLKQSGDHFAEQMRKAFR